jgi:hypothetical protein
MTEAQNYQDDDNVYNILQNIWLDIIGNDSV